MAVQLYPHQQDAVNRLENGKVLWGGVGTGKSITVAAYYMQKEAPKDVYVITTAKKRDSLDWEKEFVKFGVYKQEDATVAGVLTVDSWNNIGKYTNVHGAFFVFDEQRLVGSGAWTKAFLHIAKSNNWVLLSATPGDTWLDYIPVFVANGFYKNRTEFKREHVVYNTYSKFPKVDRYIGINKLVRLKNQILVEMPYERHTTRHIQYITVDHDKDLLKRVIIDRWHVYEERPIRDVAEMFMLMRKVVNKNEHRLEQIRCLMKKHPKLIVFYNFNYELEMLRKLADDGNKSKKRPTMSGSSSAETSSSSLTGSLNAFLPDPEKSPTNDLLMDIVPPGVATEPDQFSMTNSESSTSHQNDRLLTGIESSPSESTTESTTQTTSKSSFAVAEWNGQKHEAVPATNEKDDLLIQGTPTTSVSESTEDGSHSPTSSTKTESRSGTKESGLQQPQETSSGSFSVAEWNGHKHEPIPETDRWVYLVQYVAGSEGWNCTETDATAFFSLTYSYKNWWQAFGRIDRLNTPFTDLHYYVLKTNSVIDGAILRSLKLKKNFNESSMGIKFDKKVA